MRAWIARVRDAIRRPNAFRFINGGDEQRNRALRLSHRRDYNVCTRKKKAPDERALSFRSGGVSRSFGLIEDFLQPEPTFSRRN